MAGLTLIFLWELRGIIDKMIGGVGLKRGRRSQCDLRISDCLDFLESCGFKKNEDFYYMHK